MKSDNWFFRLIENKGFQYFAGALALLLSAWGLKKIFNLKREDFKETANVVSIVNKKQGN
jgi:hypothetical protein